MSHISILVTNRLNTTEFAIFIHMYLFIFIYLDLTIQNLFFIMGSNNEETRKLYADAQN